MQASESVHLRLLQFLAGSSYGGDIAVGAMTILTSVMQFAHAAAAGHRVRAHSRSLSYNFGAKNVERVRERRSVVLLTVCLIVLRARSGLLVDALARACLPRIFTPDAELIDFTGARAAHLLRGAWSLFGIQQRLPDDVRLHRQARVCSIIVAVHAQIRPAASR